MLAKKFQDLEEQIGQVFLDREEVIRCFLVSLLTDVPAIALGLPGQAKTAIASALAGAFGVKEFYILCGVETTSDHLFGEIDAQALMNGQGVRRQTQNTAADAHIVILDEVTRLASGTADMTLDFITNRRIRNGADLQNCPALAIFGMANRTPEELGELEERFAFWDRFVLRVYAEQLEPATESLLYLRAAGLAPTPAIDTKITLDELKQAREAVAALPFSEAMGYKFHSLIQKIRDEGGFYISPRTGVQMVRAVRAAAWLDGAAEVSNGALELLQHIAWNKPSDRSKILTMLAASNLYSIQAKQEFRKVMVSVREIENTSPAAWNAVEWSTKAGNALDQINQAATKLQDILTIEPDPSVREMLDRLYLLQAKYKQQVAQNIDM